MKKILFVILLFIYSSGNSQVYTPINNYGQNHQRIKVSYNFKVPVTSTFTRYTNDSSSGDVQMFIKGDTNYLMYHNGIRWKGLVDSFSTSNDSLFYFKFGVKTFYARVGLHNDTAFAKLNYPNTFTDINNFTAQTNFSNSSLVMLGNTGLGGAYWYYDDSASSTVTQLVLPHINSLTGDSVAYRMWVKEYVQANAGVGSVTTLTRTNGVGIIATVTNPTTTPNIDIKVDTADASIISRQRAAATYEPTIALNGTTKKYWTGYKTWGSFNDTVRAAISLTTTGSSGAATYNNSTGGFNVPTYSLSGLGGIDSIRQPADLLYANASFTKTGTTGISNAALNSQSANLSFMSPNGSSGTPTFRSIVGADIANSTIDLTTKVTGILPLANGGTGSSTQNFVDLTTAQTIAGLKSFSSIKVGTYTQYGSITSLVNTSGEMRAGGGYNLRPPDQLDNTFYGLKLVGSTPTINVGGTTVATFNFGGSNTSGSLTIISDTYNPTTGSGTTYGIRNNSSITPPSGSNSISYNMFASTPTITQSTFGTGIIRGFYHNPTITSLNTSSHRAWENTTGDALFGTTSGSVGIGANTSIAPTAIVDMTSTTKGLLTPRMTTTQKNAIASPAEGLEVYDLTLHQKSYYNGTAWVNY